MFRQHIHRMKKIKNEMTPWKSVSELLRKVDLVQEEHRKKWKHLCYVLKFSCWKSRPLFVNKRATVSIRRVLSGNIFRKYKLIKYPTSKAEIDHWKLGKNRNLPNDKLDFNDVYTQVLELYARDDISTALLGKQDVKKLKKGRFQKRTLNGYLSNRYLKLMAEKPKLKVSFANFIKMRPVYYILSNFINRRSCWCEKHQSMAVKVKILKTHNKRIPSHPDIFIKNFISNDNIQTICHSYTVTENNYEEWQKVKVVCKSKSGEKKIKKKMKIVNQTKLKQESEDQFSLQVLEFCQHAERIRNQFCVQRKLIEDLPKHHVYIHMDFA